MNTLWDSLKHSISIEDKRADYFLNNSAMIMYIYWWLHWILYDVVY